MCRRKIIIKNLYFNKFFSENIFMHKKIFIKNITIILVYFIISIINNISFSHNLNVSLISAFFDERDFVIKLSWETIDNPKVIYKVYRLKEQIKDLKQYVPEPNNLITILDYNKGHYVDSPSEKGEYYYLVSVSLDNEDNNIVLYEQNYTSRPIYYFPPPPIAQNIKAAFIGSKVFITWEMDEKDKDYIKEFRLYRSSSPITRDIVNSLEYRIIPKTNNFFIDNPKPGQYYYLLTSVSVDNLEGIFIKPNMNYTDKIIVSSYDGILPDFFIDLPFDKKFNYKTDIDLFEIPQSIDFPDLDIVKDYVEIKEPDKILQDKFKNIRLELENLSLKKDWDNFIKKIDNYLNDNTLNDNMKKELLLYKSYGFISLGRKDEAFLILKTLKSDNDFSKLNSKKIDKLIKLIDGKK